MNVEQDLDPTFDVYLSGKLLEGFTRETVVSELSRLFKLETAAAEKLVDGQRHRVKSACNKASALQYRGALTAIGVEVNVVRHGAEPSKPAGPTSGGNRTEMPKASSAPQPRAVFGDPETLADEDAQWLSNSQRPATPEQAQHIAAAKAREPGKHANFDAYRPGDKPIEFKSGDTAQKKNLMEELSIAPVGSMMSDKDGATAHPVVTPPDLEVAPAGEPIPTVKEHKTLLDPNTDHLHLEPLTPAIPEKD